MSHFGGASRRGLPLLWPICIEVSQVLKGQGSQKNFSLATWIGTIASILALFGTSSVISDLLRRMLH